MLLGSYIYSTFNLQDRNPEIGIESIKKLMESVDEWIPDPVRELDKPFLMPVDGVFSIPGRGTVVTGRVERGEMKKGDAAEFVGLKSNLKTTITGEFSQQSLYMSTTFLLDVKGCVPEIFVFVVCTMVELHVT